MSLPRHRAAMFAQSWMTAFGLAMAMLAAALAARWLLGPLLGERYPLVTLFAAIAFAAWVGGYRIAIVTAVVGWLAAAYLFLAPRGVVTVGPVSNLVGLGVYAVSSTVIIALGEAMRAARRRLARSSEELTDFVEGANVGIHRVGPEGTVLWVNQAELDMLGYERDEVVGHHISEFHVDADVIDDVLSTLQRGESLRDRPARLRAKDGSIRHVRINSSPLLDNGRFVHTRCFTLDVTDQKRAQEVQALLAAIVESTDDAVVSKSLDGFILTWNPGAERVFGYTAAEAVGQPITLIIPPELHAEEHDILDRLRQGRRIETYETVRVAKDGRRIDIALTISPIRRADGVIIGASKVARDITQRKSAEAALARAEQQLRLVTDSAPVLLARCDNEARYKFVNRPYAERFGLTPDDVVGLHVAEVVGAEAYTAFQHHVAEVLAGHAVEFEVQIPYAVGGSQFMRCAYTPELATDGTVVGLVAAITNISDRKRAEQELRDSEARYRQLTELLPVAVYTCAAPDGTITYYNEHAAELWGRAPALGDTDERFCGSFRLFLPDGTYLPHAVCPMSVALREGQTFRSQEVVIQRPDGTCITVLVNIDPIRDADGRIVAAINVFSDVSALKQAERELRDADRRKDEFLATLAHELRNPLAPLCNTLEIIKRAGISNPLLQQATETMERQVGQMVRLIDDLLDVSRITRNRLELRRDRVELAAVVQQAVENGRPLIEAARHELIVSLPDAPVWLDADAVRLAQVLANLLSNACKYTAPGGTIQVVAERQGAEVAVAVRDTGIGIPADRLGGIFEMFAQAHPALEQSQGGLGIGLTLVERLVEMHGGSVHAASAGPGQGSEFVVRLPIVAPVPAVPVETTLPVTGTTDAAMGRVLVVDDNEDAALTLAMLLDMMGYQTQTVHDGVAAVSAADEFRPDIMLLDIGLPKMNGYEVCRSIRQQPWGADISIVALTGWGQNEDRRKSRDAGFDDHLVKPVDQSALERLLAAAPARASSNAPN